MRDLSALAADEGCSQERTGGIPSQQSGFTQQPAEGLNLGLNLGHFLQRNECSNYSPVGLQVASMAGQHSRQQPSPAERHNAQRSADSRQYQQIAEAMRRGRAQQAQACHAPDRSQHSVPPARQHLRSAQHMRSNLQTYQGQQSAPVVPTWGDQAAHGSTRPRSAAMVPAAALAPASSCIEARDLYSQMSLHPDASLFHRQAFAASLSEIFQRRLGSRRT